MADSNFESTEKLFELVNQLSEKNRDHVDEIAEELEKHVDGQDPDFTTVACCDSRVMQQELWKNYVVGREFAHGVIGNHVNTRSYWDNTVVSGSIDYIPEHSDSPTGVVVIGHTGCGAVTATYQAMKAIVKDEENSVSNPTEIMEHEENTADFSLRDYTGETEGIDTDVALLIASGLDEAYEELLDSGLELDEREEINYLVERNVDNQVRFLEENTDYENTEFFGAVYDMDGSYGNAKGTLYLTNFNGEDDVEALEKKFSDYNSVNIGRNFPA